MKKLIKITSSLQTQLIASFVLLIVVIAGGTFAFTYDQTKKALLEITRDDLAQIIGLASTQFSAQEIEQLGQLKEGQETTPEYVALKKKLQAMRALSPNVVNFYIMHLVGDKIIFIVDDTDDGPAAIGQAYEEPEAKLFQAVNGLQVSDHVYTDEWGTFLSGYAPIQGTSGEATLIVGADMLATQVIQRQDFIGNTIYYVMGFAILVAALIIGLFSLTIIRDINKLNRAAEKISRGDTQVHVDIRRRDEIGELAQSFARMVASLKIMMTEEPPAAEAQPSSEEK